MLLPPFGGMVLPPIAGGPRRKSKPKVADRIMHYLYQIAPDEVSPKTISRVLKLNHASVKKELSRLMKNADNNIISDRRGWYRHKLEMDTIARIDRSKRIEMHGIKLEGVCHQANTAYSLAGAAKQRYRKRGTYKEMFEDRIVTITAHEQGLVEVWLNTSEHPIGFQQFDRFQAWVKGLLDFVDPWSWKVSQLGLNVDVREMYLEGVSSLKLSVFRDAWFQIYQKGEDSVRIETHLFPNLHLEEALTILRQLVETKVPLREGEYQGKGDDDYTGYG